MSLVLFLFAACENTAMIGKTNSTSKTTTYGQTHNQYNRTVRAHPTYYFKKEDKYGSRIAMGGRAKEGVTIAMRRAVVALGTWGYIKKFEHVLGDGNVQVGDRGRDVERLKATHQKMEVADVYLECRNRREFKNRVAYLEHKIGTVVEVLLP